MDADGRTGKVHSEDASEVAHGVSREDVPSALANPDALTWASMGVWTDVAIRSEPEVLQRAITNFRGKIAERESERESDSQKLWLVVSLFAVVFFLWCVLPVLVIVEDRPSYGPVLESLAGILLGLASFSLGTFSSRLFRLRSEKRSMALVRSVLRHEIDYMHRIHETD
jgi:hypothetical protein